MSVLNFAGRVPSLVYSHPTLIGISRVQNVSLWVFRESQVCSGGYFVGLIFSRRNFVGPKYIFAGLSWVPIFSPGVVCG